jgi:long-subunit acyl-CoA synthetase (AMP-forming)
MLPRELSADAGELTPTFKIRRRIVNEHFRDVIENLYAHAHAPQGTDVRATA